MNTMDKMDSIFGHLKKPSPRELKEALEKLKVSEEELLPFIKDPGNKPYGKKSVYRTEHVEIVVANWVPFNKCSPHDHGGSFGWIYVVSGETAHTLYKIEDGIPVPHVEKQEKTSTVFFTSQTMIHDMGNQKDQPLVTLHAYSPPVTGMRVYDLNRCASCIVSDDCGAWWPEEQKKRLREIKFKQSVH